MKTLNVMSIDFTYKAALRGFESATLTRAWNGIGALELVISTGVTNAELIDADDILWFDKDVHKAFIVERIEIALDGTVEKLYITAKGLESLLADFVTVPPDESGYDSQIGTREAIVRAWVDANCINPIDADRAQYPIVLGTIRGLGSSITEQTRYKNLADEVSRVLATEDLGWGLELNLEGEEFIFEVFQGVDRTSEQLSNSRALFGVRYGNINDYHRIRDNLAVRTVAYVGGQGEGADRTIVEVEDATAARRREVFIDARDTDVSSELTERGQQTLAESVAVSSFEFEALDRQFSYEINYDLGDYVTIVIDTSTYQHLQIRRIQEVYEQGSIRVVPEFGQPQRTLGQVISSISKQVAGLQTTEPSTPDAFPTGAIVASAMSAIPLGWLECDGGAVSRTTYSDLFGAIGESYGVGDGSMTFNIPNLKGRVIAGMDTGQIEFDTLGETGGEKTHQLTIDEMPSHSHTLYGDNDTGPDGGVAIGTDDVADTELTAEGTMSPTGGDQPHNNLQPYIALKWIIKT